MEENWRKCKVCDIVKKRILVGKFDEKNKRYHDETEKTWCGNVCPSCHNVRMILNMRLLREKRK